MDTQRIKQSSIHETVLSRTEAASFILNYHSLDHPRSLSSSNSVNKYIQRVGCIQYDPLNICGQNPDLVLQSRIDGYDPQWLRKALYEERSLVEGWNKMMAISPLEDWSLLARLRQDMYTSYMRRYPEVEEMLPFFLKEIREKGALSSLAFKETEKIDWAWGSARLAKAALEGLFFQGTISIDHREHTRRVYDLTERLLPPEILQAPDPFRTEKEYQRAHIIRRISSAGIAGFTSRDFWFGIAGCSMKDIRQIISELNEEGLLTRLRISGSGREWYALSRDLDPYFRTGMKHSYGEKAALLAPLDNMMWNRELVEDIFNFKYRWEVYTPAVKREYGYYVLPILHRGELIGRCEPSLDRKTNRVILKGFWLQEGVSLNPDTTGALREMFASFCRFLGAHRMITSPSVDRPVRSALKGITSSTG